MKENNLMRIDKSTLVQADTNAPSFIEDEFGLDWSMTRNEQYCLIKLLEKSKPEVAIEIGTYNGGSLQVISKYAKKVYAIDTDPTLIERLGSHFDNVEFLIGDSKEIVPQLLKSIAEKKEKLEFALIDGDHSTKGVQTDIENLLEYIPDSYLQIILHDSFNPKCRKGMKAPDYNSKTHVHYVELDYISGVFNPDHLNRQMWGGFAQILLLSEGRDCPLEVHQSQLKLYKIAYLHSIHFFKNLFWFLKPIYRIFKR